MIKFYKILFLSSTFMGTLISVSSQSWLGMWMGLEINLLSFIPIMSMKNNLLSNESTIKYFIVQAIASTMVMMAIIVTSVKTNFQSNLMLNNSTIAILNTALLTKMGMAPFHFWFPEVMEGQSWMNCLMIMTWQKLAPMILLMYNYMEKILTPFIITALMISGIMGINQVSLRKILAYSSINHMAWMISSMFSMKTIWILYFTIYSVISINIIYIMKKFKMIFIKQLFQTMSNNYLIKILFIINFLSLSGIPPFLGFMPKWLTIQALTQSNKFILPTLMTILTLITVFMYIRVSISTLIFNSNESKWSNYSKKNMKYLFLAMINTISLFSLATITLMYSFF